MKNTKTPIVLCYHRVIGSDSFYSNFKHRDLDVLDKNLIAQLCWLRKNGYEIADASLLKSNDYKSNQIFISFDDGYKETAIRTAKIFEDLSLPRPLLFVTSVGWNEGEYSWDKSIKQNKALDESYRNELLILSLEDIEKYKSEFIIGWHTRSHISLSQESRINISLRENISPDVSLVEICGNIDFFSYPFGNLECDISIEAIEIVKNYFTRGFTLFDKERKYLKDKDSAITPRLFVDPRWDVEQFSKELRCYEKIYS